MTLATATDLEITLELLRDIERSTCSILTQDFGIRRNAIRVAIIEAPPGLVLRVDRDWLPPSLRWPPQVLNEIMGELCRSVRAVLDLRLPSLSHGLGMRYLPDAGQIEIGIGPDTQPIYPHILTATVKEWRLTLAGRVVQRKGILPWQ
jgi:hypothetical protein